jgi:hypothetical protein
VQSKGINQYLSKVLHFDFHCGNNPTTSILGRNNMSESNVGCTACSEECQIVCDVYDQKDWGSLARFNQQTQTDEIFFDEKLFTRQQIMDSVESYGLKGTDRRFPASSST